MERYVTTTYGLNDLKCQNWSYGYIRIYMYSLSACRVSVVCKRSRNILCRGEHFSACFADMLRQRYLPIEFSVEAGQRKRVLAAFSLCKAAILTNNSSTRLIEFPDRWCNKLAQSGRNSFSMPENRQSRCFQH